MTIQMLTWLMPVLGALCSGGVQGALGGVTAGFQLPGTKHLAAKGEELCMSHLGAGME